MAAGSLTHCVSSLCDAPAQGAFAYLADAERVGEWALGCWGARPVRDGLVRGTSLFDGTPAFVRTLPTAENMTVDFEVGGDLERLERRISARVVGGGDLGGDASRSLVILLAWRTETMDDERWRHLTVAHDAEMLMLRERIAGSASR